MPLQSMLKFEDLVNPRYREKYDGLSELHKHQVRFLCGFNTFLHDSIERSSMTQLLQYNLYVAKDMFCNHVDRNPGRQKNTTHDVLSKKWGVQEAKLDLNILEEKQILEMFSNNIDIILANNQYLR